MKSAINISLQKIIVRLYKLYLAGDLHAWDGKFIAQVWIQTQHANDMHTLSERQVDRLERIYDKHV